MGPTTGQEGKKNLHASYKVLCFIMPKRKVLSLFQSAAPQRYCSSPKRLPFLISTCCLGIKILSEIYPDSNCWSFSSWRTMSSLFTLNSISIHLGRSFYKSIWLPWQGCTAQLTKFKINEGWRGSLIINNVWLTGITELYIQDKCK